MRRVLLKEEQSRIMKKALLLSGVLALSLGIGAVSAQDGITELNIWWAEWDPANYLQQIGNEYEAATGIKVNVVQTVSPPSGPRRVTLSTWSWATASGWARRSPRATTST
jgi:ABC-type glycerol-3-phosphate transport system substrate-binding protein